MNKLIKRMTVFGLMIWLGTVSGCGSGGTEFVTEQGNGQGAADVRSTESGSGLDGEEAAGRDAPEAERSIWVHICGAVVRPGVYEMEKGSRVCEALEAAGGFAEDAAQESVNLAETLEDGRQIVILTKEEQESLREEAAQKSLGLVNINSAGVEELCNLPGIGQSRAESIIAYREKAGGFGKPEEIMNVAGIKEGMYAKFKDKITIGN